MDLELAATRGTNIEKTETVLAVYLSGVLQGIALILFPAAGPHLAICARRLPAWHA